MGFYSEMQDKHEFLSNSWCDFPKTSEDSTVPPLYRMVSGWLLRLVATPPPMPTRTNLHSTYLLMN